MRREGAAPQGSGELPQQKEQQQSIRNMEKQIGQMVAIRVQAE